MRPITDTEFARFQQFIFEQAGITLSSAKQALVSGRLGKRLTAHQLESFGDYFQMLASGQHPDEVQAAVDLLTTNETYFFRETKHFDFLRQQALLARQRGSNFRVWSAASSSGEEAYSVAMVLADCLEGGPWEILGTDISTHVLQQATRALYSMERARHVPSEFLRRYCLKGEGDYAGRLLIVPELRRRVRFGQLNLNEALPEIGSFDFVLLRNVMIYFNDDTKRSVVQRVSSVLKPGGHFCVGHSETLNNLGHRLEQVAPSIYRRPS
ncbi:Chemotaxis protein methyltransferase [Rubrivivax sp. A210]|uniref:CheR family methyltransferase n=1 Tax=Rubrivivax sp. A210 TaxID=2772301 RepID=UPI00191A3296|nr:protein-glutamate O-methyltransferase CheR [Rubrivivax sp. A210]CAD5369054.1 Chemotaxis protein methyltransferase [Rubrivivax sp. A210]